MQVPGTTANKHSKPAPRIHFGPDSVSSPGPDHVGDELAQLREAISVLLMPQGSMMLFFSDLVFSFVPCS